MLLSDPSLPSFLWRKPCKWEVLKGTMPGPGMERPGAEAHAMCASGPAQRLWSLAEHMVRMHRWGGPACFLLVAVGLLSALGEVVSPVAGGSFLDFPTSSSSSFWGLGSLLPLTFALGAPDSVLRRSLVSCGISGNMTSARDATSHPSAAEASALVHPCHTVPAAGGARGEGETAEREQQGKAEQEEAAAQGPEPWIGGRFISAAFQGILASIPRAWGSHGGPLKGTQATSASSHHDGRCTGMRPAVARVIQAAASAGNRSIIVTQVNARTVVDAESWMHGITSNGFSQRTVLLADDETALESLSKRWPAQTVDGRELLGEQNAQDPHWASAGGIAEPTAFVGRRPTYLQALLRCDVTVLFSDVTTLWLNNPYPYLEGSAASVLVSGELHNFTGSSDSLGAAEYSSAMAGLSVLMVKPTPGTIGLMEVWEDRILKQRAGLPLFLAALESWGSALEEFSRKGGKKDLLPIFQFPSRCLYYGEGGSSCLEKKRRFLEQLSSSGAELIIVPKPNAKQKHALVSGARSPVLDSLS